ncbi:MAG: ThuA domain-containing protein [Chitinispirillaceae bacterium]|nr:ThuA domain-containing protein [Chitinispirillaceae bacterium]
MNSRIASRRFHFQSRATAGLILLACAALSARKPRVLVFTKTAGWDHETRVASDSVIRNLGKLNGFDVDTTDVAGTCFTDASLAGYAAVCFINTTGTLFTAAERNAFQRYLRAGGGYVGMHASTDCEYEWPWYGEMTGANFNGHPFNVATAKVAVLDKSHPSTEFITADTLTRTDEWYFWGRNPDFRNNPLIDPAENDSIHVLMELVEPSIPGSKLSHFHPICWYRNFEGARVWYCGFGHYPETFNDPLVKQMLLGGIRYSAGMTAVKTAPRPAAPKPFVLAAGEYKMTVYDIRGRVVRSFIRPASGPLTPERLLDMATGNRRAAGAGWYLVAAEQGATRIAARVVCGNDVINKRLIGQRSP